MSHAAVVVFTRDLRVHDNPALAAACTGAEHAVPLFVLDPAIDCNGFASANRDAFLTESLADLDHALRRVGGKLILRRGNTVEHVCRIAEQVRADRVHLAADVSGYATRRERALHDALAGQRRELVVHAGVHTVLAPGEITPASSDHYAVFTPYWRRWAEAEHRPLAPTPRRVTVPRIATGPLPKARSRPAMPGGETAGRARMTYWLTGGIHDYDNRHDDLAADATSRLSPYLHLGCISALELATLARDGGPSPGHDAFGRQLCWRDFHHQVLAARPDAAHHDYRPRGDHWRDDPDALDAWQAGLTGYPLVDAGMRQLAAEGFMHNRARLVTASLLTKNLYLDWRAGAAHFLAHLLDGDLANNNLNWQWVAGTGTDTRPNRVLNPTRQAQRYDPAGDYIRRWIPELADLPAPAIHQPWDLPEPHRRRLGYPDPIIEPGHGHRPVPPTRRALR